MALSRPHRSRPGETRRSVAWSEFAQSRTAVAALGAGRSC